MTKRIKLKVIPQPAEGSRKLFATHDRDALVRGIELVTYTCGNCDFVLAENVIPNTYTDIVFKCPSCKSYNEITNV
jgi:lipopolysaccharide biosynthesis regulator YciM